MQASTNALVGVLTLFMFLKSATVCSSNSTEIEIELEALNPPTESYAAQFSECVDNCEAQ